LDKQIYIYSVDTSSFYNESEMKIHRKLNRTYRFRNHLHKIKNKRKESNANLKRKLEGHLSKANERIKKLKDSLYIAFSRNNTVRELSEQSLSNNRIVSVFESVLTRTLGISENTTSRDIIVVQTYFFDILEDIILNGFTCNNERYVCFTASAGQIRTKKTVFIKESVLMKYRDTLMCGLTIDKINSTGGVNINKYLAYLALCNSATDLWDDFDINKAIVVDDMETTVHGIVDFIDDTTYDITRKQMDIPINHTDGCGMILPSKSKKSTMIRLPWIKGLLVPFPFDNFINEVGQGCGKVTDIYGKEYDIINDDIQIIFTKSQFKMWKFYSSWDDYKENYLRYNCHAGKCNEEEDIFSNAKLNYQMLQTLTDMTDKEIEKICTHTKDNIIRLGRDRRTMLKVLGVTDSNTNKNYIQQALDTYPELLNDTYSKEILKQVKKSMVKEARAGKIDITGKYTFICPDLYAFCEYLFLGDENPKGLLRDGEVHCSLYKYENKLNCLRSPHLYREHAIRKNVIDEEVSKWFITKGLYTSCHDTISKILMFDVDGDKALVCADHTIINVAERNMANTVPLFYNMATANKELITNQSVYDGLKAAYTGGNIGMISNDITKIWNSEHININVIKWLTMENNFTIDYAKTLYKPIRPNEVKSAIKEYTKYKAPHFFLYAKGKTKKEVEKVNDSLVNRLENIIPNPRINFMATNLGKFDYRLLMSGENVNVDLNKSIIDKYTELDLQKRFMEIKPHDEHSTGDNLYPYIDIRNQILASNKDVKYVVDVLIEYLYKYKNSSYKTTLWSSFGDVIVDNLKRNLKNKYGEQIFRCTDCKEIIENTSNRKKYCNSCWGDKEREQTRERVRRHRNVTV
jgi:hypothetical protein